ncbi:MAG: hypothetical protein E7302_13410 [Butyrivibrio sp.]|nr:hypothetical protein [Butyrivibrio sp.]
MLYSVDSCKYVDHVPHQKEFDKWMKRLSDDEYQKILEALYDKIGEDDISTAGWIPGHDWTDTVFDYLMKRKDKVWGFGRYEKDGQPISSMTYFVIKNAPKR